MYYRYGMARETLLDVDNQAQVAELVDAMVSNTIGVKPVSVRVRPWVSKAPYMQ